MLISYMRPVIFTQRKFHLLKSVSWLTPIIRYYTSHRNKLCFRILRLFLILATGKQWKVTEWQWPRDPAWSNRDSISMTDGCDGWLTKLQPMLRLLMLLFIVQEGAIYFPGIQFYWNDIWHKYLFWFLLKLM